LGLGIQSLTPESEKVGREGLSLCGEGSGENEFGPWEKKGTNLAKVRNEPVDEKWNLIKLEGRQTYF